MNTRWSRRLRLDDRRRRGTTLRVEDPDGTVRTASVVVTADTTTTRARRPTPFGAAAPNRSAAEHTPGPVLPASHREVTRSVTPSDRSGSPGRNTVSQRRPGRTRLGVPFRSLTSGRDHRTRDRPAHPVRPRRGVRLQDP